MREGPQVELLNAWRARQYLLVISPFILAEVQEVLSQRSLRQKYRLQESQLQEFLRLLHLESFQVSGTVKPKVCRDPDDDAILGCAMEGEADYLATGDQDLLILGDYRTTRIVTARRYLERLRLER